MRYKLRLTDGQYNEILRIAEKNSPAVMLCGHRRSVEIISFIVHQIISFEEITLHPNSICNTGLVPMLVFASIEDGNSQPDLVPFFDNEYVDSMIAHTDECIIVTFNKSAIKAAVLGKNGVTSIGNIQIVGDDLKFFGLDFSGDVSFMESHGQAFGEKTINMLRRLEIAVVGCSGTGSPVIEQLARLGVGKIVLVDPDFVEKRNLNRILNTTYFDAKITKSKVQVLRDAIQKFGLGTSVEIFQKDLIDSQVIQCIANCDFLFGCVDSASGRHYLNKVCIYYTIPYIDVGVKLVADGNGGISDVSGAVHFVRPDGMSLMQRGLYNAEELRVDGLLRTDPGYCHDLEDAGYILGAKEASPAVISVNMFAASMAVNEFLGRLHPFRNEPNSNYAENRFSLTGNYLMNSPESPEQPQQVDGRVGRGDTNPLLGLPSLSKVEVG